jgi:uncharacterized protein involved in exopolysaccharide biosynthesis
MAPQEPVPTDVVDLTSVWAQVTARWPLMVAIVAGFTGAATGAAFVMTPVYRATTVLAPATNQNSGRGLLSSALSDLGGVAALAGLDVGKLDPQTEEAMAVLGSREFTESFVHDFDLMPKLFLGRWDAAHHTWKPSWWRDPPTPAKAFELFERRIRVVNADKKSGLISVQIDWRDRNEAAAWANELVRRVNEEMRTRAIEQADASMAYLEKELQAAQTVTARDAVSRLMETQIKQRMVATVSREYAFTVVDRALPPDRDDPIKPQKPVLIAEGFLLGAVVAVVVAMRSRRRPARA